MLGTNRKLGVILFGGVAMTITACSHYANSIEVQNEQMDESKVSHRIYQRDMIDNGMIQDMSLADHHFVAHTSELSGTGVARLDRMSQVLDVYGGTVNYESSLTDAKVIEERLGHVREYLTMTGCNMDQVKIQAGLAGGRGMPADRAIKILDRGVQPAGEAKPAWAAGQSGGSGGGQGSGQGGGQ